MDAAMAAAVSGLKAQSTALGTISNNLANSSTTGYKAVSTQFLSQLTTQGSETYYPAGGTRAVSRQNLSATGNISSTTTTTDMAVDGTGFFVVQYGNNTSTTNPYSSIYYTRNGAFSPNDEGYLKLSGTNYYLMGWPTDPDGTLSSSVNTSDLSSLETINIDKYNSSAGASSYYTQKANLPAEATTGATFSTSMQVYDTLGVAQIYSVTYTKTGSGKWTMDVANPTNAAGVQSGTVTGTSTYYLTFDSNGALEYCSTTSTGTDCTAPIITATYDDGSTNANFTMNIGTTDNTSNIGALTQYDTGQTTAAMTIKSKSTDGVQYGDLTGVSVDSNGYVVAAYSNGTTTKIYKIPIATFNNEDGLSARSDGVYAETSQSGNYVLNFAGENGSGTIDGQSLEASNVDTATEFSNMITCQQAYSAASQVIGTDKQMFQSLLQQMQ